MKRLSYTALALMITLSPLVSVAQAARVDMPDFSGLAAKAKESVDIALDKDMLRTAASFMSGAEDPQFAEQVKRLDGVYIKTFEFDKAGQYSMSDVDTMVRQVEKNGWKKLMSIRDGEDRVEMWMRQDSHDGGMFFVASEPKELVVINIVGSVDLETLRKLQGRMGVPGLPGFGFPMAPAAPPAPPARPKQ